MRSLFTKKTPLKTIPRFTEQTQQLHDKNLNNETNDLNNLLSQILALPLPKIIPDNEYENLDIFTAASLNSETVQHFIDSSNTSVASTSLSQKNSHDQTNSESLINAVNIHKWTPLMYSAYLGHKKMSQLLLSCGANTEARNDYGQTSLMMAASCGSADVVDVLLQYSAKINVQDKFGRSPLHYAIKYNQAKITSILLEKGANPNLSDFEGMTPTLMACEIGNEATVTTLLQNKGDIFLKNKRNENGITLANDHAKVLAILRQQKTKNSNENKNFEDSKTFSTKILTPTNLLTELGLEKYIKTFQDFKVNNFNDFLNLTDEKLNQMGITLFGPKKKILDVVQQYRKQETSKSTNEISNSVLSSNNDTNLNLQQKLEELQLNLDEETVHTAKIEKIKKFINECQQEVQNLKKINVLKTQTLHENQILLNQIYSMLKQTLTAPKSDLANIKTLLKQIEQTNTKISNLIKE